MELDSEGQAHRAKARVGSKGLEWPRGPFLWRAGRRLPQSARLNQDQAGRTSGERLCPDDMFEHPPTMTGFVNVSRKKISEFAKVPSC